LKQSPGKKKVTSMDWFPSISHRSRPRKSSTARCFRPSVLNPPEKIATVESRFLPSESLMEKPEGPEIQDDCPLIVAASCFAIHRSLQTVRSREAFRRTDYRDAGHTSRRPGDHISRRPARPYRDSRVPSAWGESYRPLMTVEEAQFWPVARSSSTNKNSTRLFLKIC